MRLGVYKNRNIFLLSYKVNVISLPMTNYVNFLFTFSRYGEEDFNWAKIDKIPQILYENNTG